MLCRGICFQTLTLGRKPNLAKYHFQGFFKKWTFILVHLCNGSVETMNDKFLVQLENFGTTDLLKSGFSSGCHVGRRETKQTSRKLPEI